MKQYIGTKLIEAEPMTRGAYNEYRGWQLPAGENPEDDGYLVKYSDNYVSWSPAWVFESAYLSLTDSEVLPTKEYCISQSMVDDFIVGREVITMGDKCVVVRAILRNGFDVVESCVSVGAEGYNKEGCIEVCMERIESQVYYLLHFLIHTAVNGVNGTDTTGETEAPAEEQTCDCESCGCRDDCSPCGMGFGEALHHLKYGRRVRRAGWNGNGIFIEMQKPDKFSKMSQPYIFIDTRGLKTDNPAAPKGRVPWVASQTDMLATDWEVV